MRARRTRGGIYFIASIVIHVLLVIVWSLSDSILPASRPDIRKEQSEDRLDFELIEVPDDVPREKPDAATNLASDKNTRAADMNPEDIQDAERPYSVGDLQFEAYDRPEAADPQSDPLTPAEGDLESELAGNLAWMRSIDYLEEMKTGPRRSTSRKPLSYRNLLSSSEREGGLRFNTYDWDFAPYMLAMKRKVERHLYPPYAFTHMGVVSGTNIIRFIVMPDGSVRDLEILQSETHNSLDLTSVRAIELSLPFLPLPTGFPEDYLEVTAHFSYVVAR